MPKAPKELQITNIQSRAVELQWQDENTDPLLQYWLQLTRVSSGVTVNQTVESGRTSFSLQQLLPFTSYQIQVQAINSAGTGPPSLLVEFQTLEEGIFDAVKHCCIYWCSNGSTILQINYSALRCSQICFSRSQVFAFGAAIMAG